MWDFSVGRTLGLMGQTLPFIVFRIIVYFGIAVGYVLVTGVGVGVGWGVGAFGDPDFRAGAMTWGGIAGPAGLPPEVVQRLSTALHATMNDPEVKARYASIGSNLANSTPAEMDAFVKSETGKWGAIIKQLGLKSTE